MSASDIPHAQRSKPWRWVVIIGLIGLLLAISPPGQLFLSVVWILLSIDSSARSSVSTSLQEIPGSSCQVVSFYRDGGFVTSNIYSGHYIRDPSRPSGERIAQRLPVQQLIGVDSDGTVHFTDRPNDSSWTVPCMDGKRPSIRIQEHSGSSRNESDFLVDSFQLQVSGIRLHGRSQRPGDSLPLSVSVSFGFLRLRDSAGSVTQIESVRRIDPDSSGPMRHEWSRRKFLFPKAPKPRLGDFPPEAAMRKSPIPTEDVPRR